MPSQAPPDGTPAEDRHQLNPARQSLRPCRTSDTMRARVVSRMRSALVLCLAISDEDSGSEEEANPIHKKRGIKLGKLHTGDTCIITNVEWLHKVIYTSTGRYAKYGQLSIMLFISRYLVVMSAAKESVWLYMIQHLQDIMGDKHIYGWESIWSFHTI